MTHSDRKRILVEKPAQVNAKTQPLKGDLSMTTYCISYDLNKTGQDYKGLYGEIKRSASWWHYLDSTWLVSSSETANQIAERLNPHIDSNDRLLVIGVTSSYQGWLPEKAWQWIREHC